MFGKRNKRNKKNLNHRFTRVESKTALRIFIKKEVFSIKDKNTIPINEISYLLSEALLLFDDRLNQGACLFPVTILSLVEEGMVNEKRNCKNSRKNLPTPV